MISPSPRPLPDNTQKSQQTNIHAPRRAEDFYLPLKIPTASAGFEPTNLGTKGQHATSRPSKPLSTRYGAKHFRHSAMTHQSGDCSLPLNIWQLQRKLYPCDFFAGVQAAASTQRDVLWIASSVRIRIKKVVICSIICRMFLVIFILRDIL